MLLLQDGTTIDERYQIVGTIGSGGFGSVYKAFQKQFDRNVALKVLNTNVLEEADGLPRFEREAKAIAGLRHKNIVAFYGYGVWQNAPYMVMELIEGTSLGSKLIKEGRVDPLTASRIMKQVCDALSCAHANGVVHRDLKPSNIMLEPGVDGREVVKLIDFGLVKLMPGYGVANQKLTEAGTAVGTCYYMSPEQCVGGDSDHRVDIYAAGCIFYQMLTGSRPFEADELEKVMAAHLHEAPLPLAQSLGSSALVDALQAVINKSMAKDVDDRYQSSLDMAADLDSILRGESGKLAHQGRTSQKMILPRLSPRASRKRNAWIFAAIAGLIAAGAVALNVTHSINDKPSDTVTDTSSLQLTDSLAPASRAASAPEIEAEIERADQAYRNGKIKRAIEMLEELLTQPLSPHAQYVAICKLGEFYVGQGEHHKASVLLEKGLAGYVVDEGLKYDLMEMLASARLLQSRFGGADDVFRQILLSGPPERHKRAVLGLSRIAVFSLKPDEADLRIKELDAILLPEQKVAPPILLLKITEAALQNDKFTADALVSQLESQPYSHPANPYEREIWTQDAFRCQKELHRNKWEDLRQRVADKLNRHWKDEQIED